MKKKDCENKNSKLLANSEKWKKKCELHEKTKQRVAKQEYEKHISDST